MKIAEKSWSADARRTMYQSAYIKERNKEKTYDAVKSNDTEKTDNTQKDSDLDLLSRSLEELSKPASSIIPTPTRLPNQHHKLETKYSATRAHGRQPNSNYPKS